MLWQNQAPIYNLLDYRNAMIQAFTTKPKPIYYSVTALSQIETILSSIEMCLKNVIFYSKKTNIQKTKKMTVYTLVHHFLNALHTFTLPIKAYYKTVTYHVCNALMRDAMRR